MSAVATPLPPVEGVWRRWGAAALVPVVLVVLFPRTP
jgi:hypothetical protein